MTPLNLADVRIYVEENIGVFHTKRLECVATVELSQVLKRKNPYLFKAKGISFVGDLVKSIVDAHLSSNEEGIFGNWLEGLAIFVNTKVYSGWKSGIQGIDLEFDKDGARYIVTIKSGPNWGNASQIRKMKEDFATAQRTLRTSNSRLRVIAVNGCCYGKDNHPDKGEYFKLCGQDFWTFISDNDSLFVEIIEPLGLQAKQRNDHYQERYDAQLNALSEEFMKEYVTPEKTIDWEKIVRLNSGSTHGRELP